MRALTILLFVACGNADDPKPPIDTGTARSGTGDTDTDTHTDTDTGTGTGTGTGTDLPARSLILSEVCDDISGDGLAWVELYNAGATAVDLGEYSLRVYRDGRVDADAVTLPARGLAPGAAWVVAQEGSEAAYRATWETDADQYGAINLDGDDTIVLFDGDSTVDVYGEVGTGAGAEWAYTDATAVREASVRSGQATWQAEEWSVSAGNSTASPGVHPADAPTTPGTTTTDPADAVLVISEVVDHAEEASIKYVELYNAGLAPVVLGGWSLRRYSNGGVSPSEIALAGVVDPGDAFVIVGASGADAFRAAFGFDADQTSGAVNGNGNDVYELTSPLGPLDVYGEIGVDGLGTDWDYTDAVASRLTRSESPTLTWDPRSWSVRGGSGDASPGVHPPDAGTVTTPIGAGRLLLAEVVDHADEATIKYIEVYNPGPDSADLSLWAIDRYSNGGVSPTTLELSPVILDSGEAWVVADTRGDDAFLAWFGFDADQYSGTINGNGNDTYVLTAEGLTIDVYGELGIDGVGTPWEYTDRVATRDPMISAPRTTWAASEWRIIDGTDSTSPGAR